MSWYSARHETGPERGKLPPKTSPSSSSREGAPLPGRFPLERLTLGSPFNSVAAPFTQGFQMKKMFALLTVALGLGVSSLLGAACGNGSTSGGTTGGTTGGQSCTSAHVCVNGACNCGSDGSGSSCTDDTKCDSECQVCM